MLFNENFLIQAEYENPRRNKAQKTTQNATMCQLLYGPTLFFINKCLLREYEYRVCNSFSFPPDVINLSVDFYDDFFAA